MVPLLGGAEKTERMKTPELKHILPYVPFKVMSAQAGRFGLVLVKEIDCTNVMRLVDGNSTAKILLLPLSYLTRQELLDQGFTSHLDYFTYEHQSWPEQFPILKAPYDMVECLISKHYDVFGLLEEELAYNKKDVK